MSDIREQIAKLSPEQRKQFLQRLQQVPQPTPSRISQIPRRADPRQAPLSFAQQRMWLLDQLEPGDPLYTMTPTMRLTGPLDIAALARSLNTIIQRHVSRRGWSAGSGARAAAHYPAAADRPARPRAGCARASRSGIARCAERAPLRPGAWAAGMRASAAAC